MGYGCAPLDASGNLLLGQTKMALDDFRVSSTVTEVSIYKCITEAGAEQPCNYYTDTNAEPCLEEEFVLDTTNAAIKALGSGPSGSGGAGGSDPSSVTIALGVSIPVIFIALVGGAYVYRERRRRLEEEREFAMRASQHGGSWYGNSPPPPTPGIVPVAQLYANAPRAGSMVGGIGGMGGMGMGMGMGMPSGSMDLSVSTSISSSPPMYGGGPLSLPPPNLGGGMHMASPSSHGAFSPMSAAMGAGPKLAPPTSPYAPGTAGYSELRDALARFYQTFAPRDPPNVDEVLIVHLKKPGGLARLNSKLKAKYGQGVPIFDKIDMEV